MWRHQRVALTRLFALKTLKSTFDEPLIQLVHFYKYFGTSCEHDLVALENPFTKGMNIAAPTAGNKSWLDSQQNFTTLVGLDFFCSDKKMEL